MEMNVLNMANVIVGVTTAQCALKLQCKGRTGQLEDIKVS